MVIGGIPHYLENIEKVNLRLKILTEYVSQRLVYSEMNSKIFMLPYLTILRIMFRL